jgi:hypothetical protein
MRRTFSAIAAALAVSLWPHVAFAQCDPTVIQVHPSGAADVVEGIKKDVLRLRVIHGQDDPFLARWDAATESLTVNLQGTRIPAGDLSSIRVTLPGYRFRPIGSRPEPIRPGTGCIGHYQADVSRVWRVLVTAPGSADPIKVTYQPPLQPSPAALTESTPADIPRGGELDWTTPLKLTIYPAPKQPMSSYEVELHAADFSGSQCPSKPVDHVCHDKSYIVGRLSEKHRGGGFFSQLIEQKGVVDRIEFERH